MTKLNDKIHLLLSSDTVQISIDSDQDTHDWIRGFRNNDVTVKAFHPLNEHQIPHSLSFTIHRENLYCLDHIMDLAIKTRSALLNISYYSPVIPSDLEHIPYSDFIRLKKKVRLHLARKGISVPIGCTETGCIGGILGISVLPDGTYWDCSRSQKVIGRYPEKIRDVLYHERIVDGSCENQFLTCLRRIK